MFLHKESKEQATDDTGGPDKHVGLLDGGLGEALAQVIHEVLDAVDAVVHEWESEAELDAALEKKRHAGKGSDDAGTLEVKTDDRGDKVGGHVGVQNTGEGATGDTGPGRGAEPTLLELVDAQMGGNGTVESLLGEDLATLLGGEVDGGIAEMYLAT